MSVFSRPSYKGEDFGFETGLSNGDTVRIILDGHGPSSKCGLFGDPKTSEFVKALGSVIENFFQTHLRSADTSVHAFCVSIKEHLMRCVADFLAVQGRKICGDEVIGSTITCVLTSPENISCVIWSGDSPVYSLNTGELLTPFREAFPVRLKVEESSQDHYVSRGRRLYPKTHNNYYAGISTDTRAFAVEHYPLVSEREYSEWIMQFWNGMDYWGVSDEFSGSFVMASDGIYHLQRQFSKAELITLATRPWDMVNVRFSDRRPTDDITVISTVMEHEPRPEPQTLPCQDDESDTNEDFMEIPAE